MKRLPNLPAILCAVLCAVLWTACASTGEQNNAQRAVNVTVVNNVIPPSPLEIYLVPRAGIERSLGRVTGGTQTLQYRGLALSGEYQLVARTLSSQTYYSPIIVLENVRAIRWDLMRNFLDISTEEQ